MTDFISYYWSPDLVQDARLLTAVERVAMSGSPAAQRAEALKRLLDSHDVAAQGIAFDTYDYAEATLRHGLTNPFQCFGDELLAKARRHMDGPPHDGRAADGTPIAGANHASALGVLAHLGDEQDIERIASILDSSGDRNVIFAACLAAEFCLGRAAAHHADIVESLLRVIADKRWPDDIRVAAVQAFAQYDRPEIDGILANLAQANDLPIGVAAAHILCYRNIDLYRERLREAASRWPADAKYPADEVRAMISEEQ